MCESQIGFLKNEQFSSMQFTRNINRTESGKKKFQAKLIKCSNNYSKLAICILHISSHELVKCYEEWDLFGLAFEKGYNLC